MENQNQLPATSEAVSSPVSEDFNLKISVLKATIKSIKTALEIVTRGHNSCRCTLCAAVVEANKALS